MRLRRIVDDVIDRTDLMCCHLVYRTDKVVGYHGHTPAAGLHGLIEPWTHPPVPERHQRHDVPVSVHQEMANRVTPKESRGASDQYSLSHDRLPLPCLPFPNTFR